ncbi:MAG: penicillin-binding protein activator LpoB [Pseudomonadota bacterium]
MMYANRSNLLKLISSAAFFMHFQTSCTSTTQAEYADPTSVEIVDDRWNETDARKTAETMIQGLLEKSWLTNFKKANAGQRPLVVVGEIENRTDEHIDTKALFEYLQDEIINSGKVRFADAANREKILAELKYQNDSGMVNQNTSKKKGKQIGADFLLSGGLTSIVASNDGLKTVTYQTTLRLTDLETAEIIWSDKYLIKKRFKKSGSKF